MVGFQCPKLLRMPRNEGAEGRWDGGGRETAVCGRGEGGGWGREGGRGGGGGRGRQSADTSRQWTRRLPDWCCLIPKVDHVCEIVVMFEIKQGTAPARPLPHVSHELLTGGEMPWKRSWFRRQPTWLRAEWGACGRPEACGDRLQWNWTNNKGSRAWRVSETFVCFL